MKLRPSSVGGVRGLASFPFILHNKVAQSADEGECRMYPEGCALGIATRMWVDRPAVEF